MHDPVDLLMWSHQMKNKRILGLLNDQEYEKEMARLREAIREFEEAEALIN